MTTPANRSRTGKLLQSNRFPVDAAALDVPCPGSGGGYREDVGPQFGSHFNWYPCAVCGGTHSSAIEREEKESMRRMRARQARRRAWLRRVFLGSERRARYGVIYDSDIRAALAPYRDNTNSTEGDHR